MMPHPATLCGIVHVPDRPTLMHQARKRILVRDYLRYCNSLVDTLSDIMHYLLERGYIVAYRIDPYHINIMFSCEVSYVGGRPHFTYGNVYFEVHIELPMEIKVMADYDKLEELEKEVVRATEHAIKLVGWLPEYIWIR